MKKAPNNAPAPSRRQRFPLGSLRELEYLVCTPPGAPAAVGEARHWAQGVSGAGGANAPRALEGILVKR
jgi:hypothetical protein